MDPVIVVGMGRSGTSYISNVVSSWGVHLGSNIQAPNQGNPRGYFEDLDVVHFHSSVLYRVWGQKFREDAWINYETPTLDSYELIPEEIERARKVVSKLRQPTPTLWGWKDPRTCLFLRFWTKELPRATLVAIYRHPLEVFTSLIRFHEHNAFLNETVLIDTWAAYNQGILNIWESYQGPKVMIGAGNILADPAMLIEKLSKALGPHPYGASSVPKFFSQEFSSAGISEEAHQCFGNLFPAASCIFDTLQKLSDAPLVLNKTSSPSWQAASTLSKDPLSADRAILLPVMGALISEQFTKIRRADMEGHVAGVVETLCKEREAAKPKFEAPCTKSKLQLPNYFQPTLNVR